MNSTITFPPAAPALKLTRAPAEKWAASLAEERRRLQEDQEALRERETNLRDYEARLRALQSEIEAGRIGTARPTATPFLRPSSRTPFADDPALQAAWDKLHRAREILEAEQSHMRDERIVHQDREATLKQREDEVAAREAAVAQREELLVAADGGFGEPVGSEHTMSAMTRLTCSPFRIARSVFGGRKK
jgi:septal ring factor EnvC (AmiA/AmiB activator)